jgi:hypothetical protein
MLCTFLGVLPILTPPLCALALSCDQSPIPLENWLSLRTLWQSYVLEQYVVLKTLVDIAKIVLRILMMKIWVALTVFYNTH